MRNIGLKLFSLGIATLLWYYVHSESNAIVRTFVSAVEIRNVPEGKIVIAPQNPHAQVTVRGPAYIVSRIPAAPPVFTLVLPQSAGDKFSVALDQASLPLPANVEILNIDPPQLNLALDERKEKTVAVAVKKVGKLDSDFKLDSIVVEPDKVLLIGPQGELSGISSVEADPLDLKDINRDTSIELGITPLAGQIQMSAQRVRVMLKVSPVLASRQFDKIALEVRALSGLRYVAFPSQVEVAVEGPKRLIEKLATNDIVAYVRVPEGASDTVRSDVSVELPESLVLKSIVPKEVSLKADNGALKDLKKSIAKPQKK